MLVLIRVPGDGALLLEVERLVIDSCEAHTSAQVLRGAPSRIEQDDDGDLQPRQLGSAS